MLWSSLRQFFVILPVTLSVCGCSLSPYHLSDPQTLLGIGPKPENIIKSLRCEVIAFIEENKIRSAIRSRLLPSLREAFQNDPDLFKSQYSIYQNYISIDIDATSFAALIVEFKNTELLTFGISEDWKYNSLAHTSSSIDKHLGASYTDSKTYDLNIPMAIAQNASLGPSQNHSNGKSRIPLAAAYSTAYNEQPEVDANFYCFKSLSLINESKSIFDAANDVQNLVQDAPSWREYNNFERIYVGSIPLAEWLQHTSSSMTANEKTIFPRQKMF